MSADSGASATSNCSSWNFFIAAFLLSRPSASFFCSPPKVTIHQPVCLRNHGFGVRAMKQPSDQEALGNESIAG
jgi:hypothetical protein